MITFRLKEILNSKKVKQSELAAALGVSPMTVSGWITGRHYPSIEVLDRVASHLGVGIADFFSEMQQSPATSIIFQARVGERTIELTPELVQALATVQNTNLDK